jgi:hypothetical protein
MKLSTACLVVAAVVAIGLSIENRVSIAEDCNGSLNSDRGAGGLITYGCQSYQSTNCQVNASFMVTQTLCQAAECCVYVRIEYGLLDDGVCKCNNSASLALGGTQDPLILCGGDDDDPTPCSGGCWTAAGFLCKEFPGATPCAPFNINVISDVVLSPQCPVNSVLQGFQILCDSCTP